MILALGMPARAGSHHRRCCSVTTTQMRSGAATALARASASCKRERSPCKEQNCFGTDTPVSSVVKLRKRVPLPPASTMAHVLPAIPMNSSWRVLQPCSETACRRAHRSIIRRPSPVAQREIYIANFTMQFFHDPGRGRKVQYINAMDARMSMPPSRRASREVIPNNRTGIQGVIITAGVTFNIISRRTADGRPSRGCAGRE